MVGPAVGTTKTLLGLAVGLDSSGVHSEEACLDLAAYVGKGPSGLSVVGRVAVAADLEVAAGAVDLGDLCVENVNGSVWATEKAASRLRVVAEVRLVAGVPVASADNLEVAP